VNSCECGNEPPSSIECGVACFFPGRAKDLSAPMQNFEKLVMALLYGTSKYMWKERQVELVGLLEGTVVRAGTMCFFSNKKIIKIQFSYS